MAWGSIAVLSICAVVSGANLNDRQWMIFLFWAAIVVGMLFRSKSSDDALLQRSWIVGALVVALCFVTAVTLSPDVSYNLVIGAAVVVLVGAGIGAYTSIQVKVVHSPNMARMLEWIEAVCFASTVVLLVLILGLFGELRGH